MTHIEHKPAENRFEIHVDDALVGYADYTAIDGVRDFDHTVTDPAFRRQGLAGKLVAAALDATRADGASIATSCSYGEVRGAESRVQGSSGCLTGHHSQAGI